MDNIYWTLFSRLDYFAAPHTSHNALLLTRARTLVVTNIVVIAITILGALFIVIADSLGDLGKQFILGVLLPCGVINSIIPILLRKKGWLTLCQQLTLFITLMAIVVGICVNGGPIISSNNTLMILQAALAFFLLGIRGGLIWSLLILSCQSLLFLLILNGFDFPDHQPSESIVIGAIFNWGLSFCAIVCLILLIELNRGQLETQRRTEQERFRYLATHDDLTQLANRSLFEDNLSLALRNSRNNHSKTLLLYIDLDKFKPINDEWGHDVGDRVLKIVATRLQASTREADTVARIGGDEFAIVLPHIDKNLSIDQLAELIHNRVTQPINLHGQRLSISCSIGISSYPEDAESPSKLWQCADAAMYTAKRNNIRWHHYSNHKNTINFEKTLSVAET